MAAVPSNPSSQAEKVRSEEAAPAGRSALPTTGIEFPLPAKSGTPTGFIDAVSDADGAGPVVLAIAALLSGVVALGFVVHASPILFAEVLLDAAVVSAVYRRARARSREHWSRGVLRRTWLPAIALSVSVALGGLALQLIEPGARSLGAVFRGSP